MQHLVEFHPSFTRGHFFTNKYKKIVEQVSKKWPFGRHWVFFRVCPNGLVHLAQSLSILSLGIWMIMETKMHIKV
jgi:hypothetical protein